MIAGVRLVTDLAVVRSDEFLEFLADSWKPADFLSIL